MASKSTRVAVSAAAENSWTTALNLTKGESVALSITGTWSATVTLQRSLDGGTTWGDVTSYTANTELTISDLECDMYLRLGVKTGNYSSGTAVCQLKGSDLAEY